MGEGESVGRRWKWHFALPLEVNIKCFGGTYKTWPFSQFSKNHLSRELMNMKHLVKTKCLNCVILIIPEEFK